MTAAISPPELSLVVPFFNEEAVAGVVVAEIVSAFSALGRTWEAILVDDGSTDRTGAVLAHAEARWPQCRVVSFPKNRGQGAALFRGIHEARAPVIAMMDGDGQNLPGDFAVMLALLEKADLIVGVRAQRHDSRLRLALSRLANAVRGRMLRDGVHDAGCAMKVFRREVAAVFWPLPMLNPFMPALAVAAGFRVAEHPVQHRARQGGRSKYGLGVMWWRPFFDLLAVWWLLYGRAKKA